MANFNVDAFADEMALEMIPDAVTEIMEVIGSTATVKLVQELGGIDMQVPTVHNDNRHKQKLIELLGAPIATKLMESYGGARLYIPKCKAACIQLRNHEFVQKVLQAVERGKSQTAAIQQYAPQYGFTERWAYQILKERRAQSVQNALF